MKLLRKIFALFRRRKLDAEMSEEMQHHVELQTGRNLEAGMNPDEARYAALRQFGNVASIQEQAREIRNWVWLEQLLQDLFYAGRTLAKAPGFTVVAVLTLALGIGVNTAMFSVIYGVLLDPYPYAKSGEIWVPEITDAKTGRVSRLSFGDYLEVAKLPGVASTMATGLEAAATLGDPFSREIIAAPRLTGAAFEFLGVAPLIGRGLAPMDIGSNGEPQPVTVLSFKLWHRLFNGDRDVIGRTITLDDKPHTIVGVMPPRFGWYFGDGLWLPMTTTDLQRNVRPVVRLKPGVTKEVAEQQLLGLVQELVKQSPNRFPKDGVNAAFRNYLDVTKASGAMQSSLRLLIYAVAFLLLIACTNVANLQLARGTSRSREIAVRLALGASRPRLLRQLLTESLCLSLLSGALGVFFAFGLTQIIVALMPDFMVPNEARVTINGWVLAFSLGISVLTGVLFGLAPGLQSTRPDLNEALKDGGHASGLGGVRGARTRNALVVVEVALSIVLLVGASLTIRGFVELQSVDRGFSPQKTVQLRIPFVAQRYPTLAQRSALQRDFVERLKRVPGVAAATVGAIPSFGGSSGVTIPGQPKPVDGMFTNFVGTEYFETLGLALLAGRNLTEHEVARGDRVALISEAASKLWVNGENPIGRIVQIDSLVDGGPDGLVPVNATKEVTIVGIVADTRTRDLRKPPVPLIFVPYTLRGSTTLFVIVRTHVEPMAIYKTLHAELRALDKDQPMMPLLTIDEIIGRQVVQPRFNMMVFGALAGIALTLAAAGIYSVLSYNVTQRSREMGVRMALGAMRGDILRLILGAGGRLLLIGLVIGVAASVALAKILKSEVFIVPLLDPLALAAAVVVLSIVALVACYIPARRAAKVNPMVALRAE